MNIIRFTCTVTTIVLCNQVLKMKVLIIFALACINHYQFVYGVNQCYSCTNACDILKIELCEEPCKDPPCISEDYICISSFTKDNNTRFKGCEKNSPRIIDDCIKQNQDGNLCYTCNEELCNANDQRSVESCYFCNGTCNNPLEVENCPGSSQGKYYVCMESQITINNATTQTKGCYLYNEDIIQNCEAINSVEGGSCSLCSEDKCNHKSDSNGVTKCYSCKGTCSRPLETEDCPVSNVTSYICLASVTRDDETISETRGCYPNIPDVIATCTKANQDYNSSCYICDKDLCNNVDNNDDDDDGKGSAHIYLTSIILIGFTLTFAIYI